MYACVCVYPSYKIFYYNNFTINDNIFALLAIHDADSYTYKQEITNLTRLFSSIFIYNKTHYN